MKAKRSVLRELAMERVRSLLDTALKTAPHDLRLAQRQGAIARKLCLKYNLRLPFERKMLFCRGCSKLIVPGINCRVRLDSKRKAVRIVCLECEHIYRKILAKK